ncbi:MAG TPA: SDR family oxidoreductase [Candidatus Avipropionibacterium avicola]|uniref:SDR family oxidoreductase n=1 Tax=Candidatus Avipropionibacterium avicola TaxID=2840701 RepID=A0A9D1KP75_9ACTN|nr:SDR family oxidoreductase [Candidatus Avipropionibacterium avicola]
MSHVVVIGAHGKVALHLVPLLVGRGDRVSAVIRNPDHADELRALGADPVVADVEELDTAALTELLGNHDAVVWSAGAGGGNPARTRAVDRDAAIRSMDAAAAAGVKRYVMVSYIGSRTDHGVAEDDPFFAYAEAKAAADEHLRSTDLDWTVLGPGPLTDDNPTGKVEVVDPGRGRVSRADVAAVAAAALVEPATIGRTIAFGNGEVPIETALRQS